MRLLVVGGDRVDAGKTTFSTGLVHRVGGVGFKPRAGNDYWFDHDDYRRAVGDGRLYGKDAKRLAAASAADVTPESLNPVHRLWRPAAGREAGLVGAAHREFVLDRVGSEFVVNARADVPSSAREALALGDARHVDSVDELNDAMRSLHLPALERFADRVRDADRAVIESYGDVARPLRGVAVDAVAVVEPGRVRVFGGDAYLAACEAGERRDVGERVGRIEARVGTVVEDAEPVATVRLPALAGDERRSPAAVADAYEVAYDALLGAAVG